MPEVTRGPGSRPRGFTAVRARLRPTGNRVTGCIAVGAAGALIGTSLAVGTGVSGTRPRLADVGAWLSSSEKGEVVHVHGLTGAVDGRAVLPSGTVGHPVSVARDGRATLVLDERAGRVVRIDDAQLTAEQSADYGAAGLQLVSGGAYAYVLDAVRGTVQQVDPAMATPGGPPVELGGEPGPGVVDGEGTLWVPLPEQGTVVPFVEGRRSTAVRVAAAGHDLTLTLAGGLPVVTDRTAAAMKVLTVTGTRDVFELGGTIAGADPADVLVPAGTDGSVVPVLAAGSGELVLTDVRSRTTVRVPVPVQGREPAAPHLLGKRVYLPDESTGRLLVYDTSRSAFAEPVPVTEGAGELELFVRDGLLWVNDPDGAAAAVIDADGEVRHIAKYGTDAPSARKPGDRPVEDSVPTGLPGAPVPPRGSAPGANTSSGRTPGPGQGPRTPAPGPTGTGSAPVQEPGAPGAPQAESRSGAVRLTFSAALGATPRRYVLKGAAPDQTVVPREIGPDGPFVFEVRGGSCEEEYTFSVVAEYAGDEPTRESAPSARARPCIAPGAPRQLAFAPARGGHGGTVSWRPPDDVDGSVTYTVNGPGGPVETAEPRHTYSGLANGRIRSVAVTARNAAGTGAAAPGWMDLNPPPKRMNIVHNDNDTSSIGIRTEPTTAPGGSSRVGKIPGMSSPEVTVHCATKGSPETHSHTGAQSDVWAYLTYHDPDLDKDVTGYTADIFVDSRFDPDVWECE